METRANLPKESNANWSWVTARGGCTHTLIFELRTAQRLLTLTWEEQQRKKTLQLCRMEGLRRPGLCSY